LYSAVDHDNKQSNLKLSARRYHLDQEVRYRLSEGDKKVTVIANVLVGFIAVLHGYFLILEMFLWDKPVGLKTFGHSLESASASRVLAMNQGLYNGFLSAGLVWGLALGTSGNTIKVFFLACVMIAGIFGALTVSRKILFVQALPACIALVLVLFS